MLVKCPNCGAPRDRENGILVDVCEYCGVPYNDVKVKEKQTVSYTPWYGIPSYSMNPIPSTPFWNTDINSGLYSTYDNLQTANMLMYQQYVNQNQIQCNLSCFQQEQMLAAQNVVSYNLTPNVVCYKKKAEEKKEEKKRFSISK